MLIEMKITLGQIIMFAFLTVLFYAYLACAPLLHTVTVIMRPAPLEKRVAELEKQMREANKVLWGDERGDVK